jgi:putative ABC transport system permease protein
MRHNHVAWLISLRDLQWRRRRFAIAVVATALVFALGLLLSGVRASFDNEIERTVGSFRADAWLLKAGSIGPFTAPRPMPESRADVVRRLPGVQRADPIVVLGATTTTPSKRNLQLIGVVPGGVGSPGGADGRALRRTGTVIADERVGLDVGDRMTLNGVDLAVGGVTHGMTYFAGIPRVTVSLRTAQRLGLDGQRLATAIVTQGRPATIPPSMTVLRNGEVAEDLARPINPARDTIGLLRFLLWLVAAGIIGAIVYLSVLERVGDFAVLKAIGVSARHLLGGLLLQAVLLSLLSAALAVALQAAIAPAVAMSVEVPIATFLTLPLVAVVVGALASFLALRRAISVDPALAFSGRGQ